MFKIRQKKKEEKKKTPKPLTARKMGLCVYYWHAAGSHYPRSVCNAAVLAAGAWNSNTLMCLCSAVDSINKGALFNFHFIFVFP